MVVVGILYIMMLKVETRDGWNESVILKLHCIWVDINSIPTLEPN